MVFYLRNEFRILCPQNVIEYLYVIFMLLVSAGLFGYIIFSIKEILEVKSKKSKEYKY